MILPNPEQLLPEMVATLKQHLIDRDIQEPRFIGIRTGGVWVAQALLAAGAPASGAEFDAREQAAQARDAAYAARDAAMGLFGGQAGRHRLVRGGVYIVVDAQGRAVALTSSIEAAFGAR